MDETYYRIAYFVNDEFESFMDEHCYTYPYTKQGKKEAIKDAAMLLKEVNKELKEDDADYTVDYKVYKEDIKYTLA